MRLMPQTVLIALCKITYYIKALWCGASARVEIGLYLQVQQREHKACGTYAFADLFR